MHFPVVDRLTGEPDVPTETPDTVAAAERPVLEVSNLTTRFEIRSGALGRVRGTVHAVETSHSACRQARPWHLSVNPAAASRPPAAR